MVALMVKGNHKNIYGKLYCNVEIMSEPPIECNSLYDSTLYTKKYILGLYSTNDMVDMSFFSTCLDAPI